MGVSQSHEQVDYANLCAQVVDSLKTALPDYKVTDLSRLRVRQTTQPGAGRDSSTLADALRRRAFTAADGKKLVLVAVRPSMAWEQGLFGHSARAPSHVIELYTHGNECLSFLVRTVEAEVSGARMRVLRLLEPNRECPICLAAIVKQHHGDTCTACGTRFHHACFEKQVKAKLAAGLLPDCPVCRASLAYSG